MTSYDNCKRGRQHLKKSHQRMAYKNKAPLGILKITAIKISNCSAT